MSADSPRHGRAGGPLTVASQPPSDRTLIDTVSGFINDVTLASAPAADARDSIQWARFETADINEPAPEGDNEAELSPLLLILGYGSGVQVWLIPPNGEAQEVMSWRQGSVRVLRILPTPSGGDGFAVKRPLLALCDSAGPGPLYCSLSFISIRGGDQVKSIKFKNAIVDVLANKRSVVVSFSERFAVFDACTLEDRLAVTTCYPCPCPLGNATPVNPLAIGDRWLAYADKKLNPAKRSSGGCEGEGVSSYTATVLHAAKSLSKGLRGLGESVASSLAGGRTLSQSPSPPNTDHQQPGVVTILDIEGTSEEDNPDGEEACDSVVAHFVAHSDAIISLKFDASGMLLVTADKRGHDFHVFRIHPHPCGPSLASVHHLYILHRGDTTAKVQDIAISLDSRWTAVSTLRGTTHVFPISPYGGPCGVRTHTQPRVVNRLSRFHRSAGLPIQASNARSSSPVGDGLAQGAWFPNPRLPPYPLPATAAPLAQLRPTSTAAGIPTHTITRNSSGRQRLSSLSEEAGGVPLLACARWGAAPPAPAVPAAGHAALRSPAAHALYVMAATGHLLHYLVHPRAAAGVAKEKVCDDTALEVGVELVAQWPLSRPPAAPDMAAPLANNNPLLHRPHFKSYSDAGVSEEERWLAQVEIVTHAGPHRRLWMGPQFVFKTYNAMLSGSSSSLLEAEAVEVEAVGGGGVARSPPVNMPGARPLVPVLIDSGSASSLEQSPSDSFRRKSYILEAGSKPVGDKALGDVQLREDLAEAMRETEQGSRRDVGPGQRVASVARAVDPLGTVVAPGMDDDGGSQPEDPDQYTQANTDEALFRPVVRAPTALPPQPELRASPLPAGTRIPVQNLTRTDPLTPDEDSVPLKSEVVIPAALTRNTHPTLDNISPELGTEKDKTRCTPNRDDNVSAHRHSVKSDEYLSPQRHSVKTDYSPQCMSLKDGDSPQRTSPKKDISPQRTTLKKDISPQRITLKKDISPQRTTLKKDISPQRTTLKKDISPQRTLLVEKDVPRRCFVKDDHIFEDDVSAECFSVKNDDVSLQSRTVKSDENFSSQGRSVERKENMSPHSPEKKFSSQDKRGDACELAGDKVDTLSDLLKKDVNLTKRRTIKNHEHPSQRRSTKKDIAVEQSSPEKDVYISVTQSAIEKSMTHKSVAENAEKTVGAATEDVSDPVMEDNSLKISDTSSKTKSRDRRSVTPREESKNNVNNEDNDAKLDIVSKPKETSQSEIDVCHPKPSVRKLNKKCAKSVIEDKQVVDIKQDDGVEQEFVEVTIRLPSSKDKPRQIERYVKDDESLEHECIKVDKPVKVKDTEDNSLNKTEDQIWAMLSDTRGPGDSNEIMKNAEDAKPKIKRAKKNRKTEVEIEELTKNVPSSDPLLNIGKEENDNTLQLEKFAISNSVPRDKKIESLAKDFSKAKSVSPESSIMIKDTMDSKKFKPHLSEKFSANFDKEIKSEKVPARELAPSKQEEVVKGTLEKFNLPIDFDAYLITKSKEKKSSADSKSSTIKKEDTLQELFSDSLFSVHPSKSKKQNKKDRVKAEDFVSIQKLQSKENASSEVKNYPPIVDLSEELKPTKKSEAKMDDAEIVIVDKMMEDFPTIASTHNRYKKRWATPSSSGQSMPPPVKSYSSIAAVSKPSKDTKYEESFGLELVEDILDPPKPCRTTLHEKLAELCKRTDIAVAECDAPDDLMYEEPLADFDLPPLDFSLDEFKLEVMRDSLLDSGEKLVSPICSIDIDDILLDVKDEGGRDDERKEEERRGQEIKPPTKAGCEQMEKSSDEDNISPVSSQTDSDDREDKRSAATDPTLPVQKTSNKKKARQRKRK